MLNGTAEVKNLHEMGLSDKALLNFIPKMERLGICTLAIVKNNQVFSIWLNSSSTGVARPKIVTDTRRRFFS